MRSHIARRSSSPPSGGGVRGSRLAQPVMPHIKLILKRSEIWEDVDVEKFHHAFFLDEIIIKGFWSHDIHRNIFRNSKLSVASLYARNIMNIGFGVFPHASNVLY